MNDAANYLHLLALLAEAKAALGPEFFELAGRIDDALFPAVASVSDSPLVLESYGAGYAWLRAS